ncbi:hypothetical protein OOK13_39135 [Streptomyces sp. NBC_00378]|uniref:hypothetical protein n=1 Tax=unclassified Streptomyces TaxID=2593676 RepID=UPI00225BFAE3|nr:MULTISPECIES: hypothetical protein [unclassified Streptomyces]MCX5114374.1 hypothetical protein [Streptomyces sp. NBC_00378]
MPESPPTDTDVLNVVDAIKLLVADAAIEDALAPRPAVPEVAVRPDKARAADILRDFYRLGFFDTERGE